MKEGSKLGKSMNDYILLISKGNRDGSLFITNAWEQYRLGDLGKTQSGVGFPENEQGGNEGIPFFKVSDMNSPGNENEMVFSNNYVTSDQINRKGWRPVEPIPAMFFAKVGAAVMLNRKRLVNKPFLLDNNTMAYTFDSTWDVRFGKVLFDTIFLPDLVQVGALPSYNGTDVESIEKYIPIKLEQAKIGALFDKIDHLITLHQRLQKSNNTKRSENAKNEKIIVRIL